MIHGRNPWSGGLYVTIEYCSNHRMQQRNVLSVQYGVSICSIWCFMITSRSLLIVENIHLADPPAMKNLFSTRSSFTSRYNCRLVYFNGGSAISLPWSSKLRRSSYCLLLWSSIQGLCHLLSLPLSLTDWQLYRQSTSHARSLKYKDLLTELVNGLVLSQC